MACLGEIHVVFSVASFWVKTDSTTPCFTKPPLCRDLCPPTVVLKLTLIILHAIFFLHLFACVFTLDVSPKAEKQWLCFWSIANSQDFSELFNFPTVFKAGLNIIYSMRCFHRAISQNFSIQWPLGSLIYLSTVVENLHFFFFATLFF